MRMNLTATAVPMTDYPRHVHNCLRTRACELPFQAPIPGVPYLELYVPFGPYKPLLVEFELLTTCDDTPAEQIFPANYVIGQTPEGDWYGVFKYFNTPLQAVTTFVVWLDAFVDTGVGLVERTFFSEEIMVDPCQPLMKVKACQPGTATTTGFDVNGVYYGLPVNTDFLGQGEVRYFHIAWVRRGKVRELATKGTFTQSLTRSFRSEIERSWVLECEIVPQWYKDELLAIYARGAVQVDDGTTYLVSELALEALNDDDRMWKAFVQLKQTLRLYFGCDESTCVECCSPTILSATVVSSADSTSASATSSAASPAGPDPRAISLRVSTSEDPGDHCATTPDTFYLDGVDHLAPGVIVYDDAGLTTPDTGNNLVSEAAIGTIYTIGLLTGIVGSPTGDSC